MIATSSEGSATTPWTLIDVAWSTAFVVVATVLVFGGIILLRGVVPAGAAAVLALLGAFLAELAMLAAAWLFGTRKYSIPWSALGFRAVDPVIGFALVAVVLLASFTVNVVYVQVIGYLDMEWLRPPPILPSFLTGIWRLVVPLALASVVAPLVEETFFRGFVFAALKKNFGFWLAAIGSGLLFTLAHLQASVLVPIFVLGVMLAWLYETTRSIWPCIALHFIYNTFALLVAYSVEVSRSTT